MNGMPLWLSMVISVITLRGRSFQRCKFWWLYVIPEIIQPHGWLQNDESIDQSLPWLRLCGNENERPCLLSVRSGLVVRGLRSAKEKRPLQRPGMVHRGWSGYRLFSGPWRFMVASFPAWCISGHTWREEVYWESGFCIYKASLTCFN